MGTDGTVNLRPEALVFFKRWKDNRTHTHTFITLSNHYAKLLDIENDVTSRNLSQLVKLDYFSDIDLWIIHELSHRIMERTISASDCGDIIRQRRVSFWYDDFDILYQALDHGARFFASLDKTDLSLGSLADGVQRYTQTWYQVDQLYRQYSYYARVSKQATLLGELSKQIDDFYVNKFLYTVNTRWQQFVDAMDRWVIPSVNPQQNFYFEYVKPFVDGKARKKIYVIISDALRYEVGEELMRLIRQEDRYDADLDVLLTTLPSYTQLGMAALLPHDTLKIDPALGANTVYVDDGQSTQGTDNRAKILASVGGTAIQAEQFMGLSRDEAREMAKAHDVIYIYHNQIDNTGDDLKSQVQTFEAVQNTLSYLVDLIKKLTNANANNIIVTADHGFLFQNNILDQSDFINEKPAGKFFADNRRYVMGTQLQDNDGFKRFTSEQLGLEGNFEVQIPKGINRLRQQGSGSQYVHGGASLQEILIPVVRINKKRTSDTRQVDVRIVTGSKTVISTGQLSFRLYQEEAVTDKVQARTVTVGLYASDGTLISDQHEFTFDLTAQNERERDRLVQLILSKEADSFENQSVYVRLKEQESGTSHYVDYGSAEYTLRRSFKTDFDF